LESLFHWGGGYADAEFPDAKFAVPAFEVCELDRRFGEHARLPNALEFPHISSFFREEILLQNHAYLWLVTLGLGG
jgi:hypothetical protein